MTTICGARQLGRTCEWDRPAHLVLCRVHRTRVRRRRRGRGRHNAAACRDERRSRRCFVQVHRGSLAGRGHTQLGCRDGRGEQDGAGHGLAPPGTLIVYGSGEVLLTLGDRAPRVRDGGVKFDAVTVLTLTGFDAVFDDVILLVNRQCVISRCPWARRVESEGAHSDFSYPIH